MSVCTSCPYNVQTWSCTVTVSYYPQSISPGLVKTNFAFTATDKEAANECYNTRQSLDPEDIANAIETVLATPPHVQVSK